MRARVLHGLVCLGYSAAFGLSNPVLPFHTRSCIDASADALPLSPALAYSLVLSSYSTAKLLCLPLITSMADRYGAVAVLRITMLGLGLSLFLSAFATSFEAIFVLRTCTGIFGCNSALLHVWVSDLLASDAQPPALHNVAVKEMMSDGFLLWNVASVLGGAVAYLADDYALIYVLSGMGPVLATLLLVCYAPAHVSTRTAAQSASALSVPALARSIWTDRGRRWILWVDAVTLVSPRLDLVPLLADLGRGMTSYTLLLACGSAASIAVTMFSFQPRYFSSPSLPLSVSRCYAVMAVIVLLLPACSSVPLVCALVIARAVVIGACEPAEKSLWTSLAPPGAVGAFVGLQHTVRGAGQSIGTFLSGQLATHGSHVPFIALAACYSATAAINHRVHMSRKVV